MLTGAWREYKTDAQYDKTQRDWGEGSARGTFVNSVYKQIRFFHKFYCGMPSGMLKWFYSDNNNCPCVLITKSKCFNITLSWWISFYVHDYSFAGCEGGWSGNVCRVWQIKHSGCALEKLLEKHFKFFIKYFLRLNIWENISSMSQGEYLIRLNMEEKNISWYAVLINVSVCCRY